ncbi:MAG: phytanoyl-CoA dioxygenase family protein, partial [Halieaceae bacterium]
PITSDDPNTNLLQSQSLSDLNIAPGEICELSPGEVSLHHGWTIHRSSPNRSADRRIGLNIQYIRPSMRQLKADIDTALLVRGRDQYGHFKPDVPATEWVSEIAAQRLADCSAQYQAIAGR